MLHDKESKCFFTVCFVLWATVYVCPVNHCVGEEAYCKRQLAKTHTHPPTAEAIVVTTLSEKDTTRGWNPCRIHLKSLFSRCN